MIDCKIIHEKVKQETIKIVEGLENKPRLLTIWANDDHRSELYVNNKMKCSEDFGCEGKLIKWDKSITQKEAERELKILSMSGKYSGIIVQSPVYDHLDEGRLVKLISYEDDADCLGKERKYDLMLGKTDIVAPTAQGVIDIIKHKHDNIHGLHVVLVGRGVLCNSHLRLALDSLGCVVTTLHSKVKTSDFHRYLKNCDVIVEGTGISNLVHKNMIGENQTLISITINRNEETGKFENGFDPSCKEKTGNYTSVLGSTGPLTVSNLIKNTAKLQREKEMM